MRQQKKNIVTRRPSWRLDPHPLARDPAGVGGVAWANQGWIGLKAETTAEPSRNGPGPRFGGIGKYCYMLSLPMSRWDLIPFLDRPFKGSERASYSLHQ